MKLSPSKIVIGNRVRQNPDAGIQELAQSIRTLGQLQPVVIDEDHGLIAGARRVRACELLGIDVECFVATTVDDLSKRLQAERDENTCRLNFTPSEAVLMASRLDEFETDHAAKRKAAGTNQHSEPSGKLPEASKGQTRDKVASAVGMSGKTYEKAKAVVKAASKPGAAPEVIKAQQDMDRTGRVDPAFKKLQNSIKSREHAASAEKAAKALKGDDDQNIILGDFREIGASVPSESVALIFTDPPYDRDSLPMFSDLSAFASRVLVDGGSLVTFCGQYVLTEVIDLLQENLRYFWINCCLHTGDSAQMREYGIKVKWKPMLWFVKGDFRRDRETWVDDLISSEQQKDFHPWQQSLVEAEYFIERLSSPGEFVVDPFCGGGTTPRAAKNKNRRWWSCDIDPVFVQKSRERLAAK